MTPVMLLALALAVVFFAAGWVLRDTRAGLGFFAIAWLLTILFLILAVQHAVHYKGAP